MKAKLTNLALSLFLGASTASSFAADEPATAPIAKAEHQSGDEMG